MASNPKKTFKQNAKTPAPKPQVSEQDTVETTEETKMEDATASVQKAEVVKEPDAVPVKAEIKEGVPTSPDTAVFSSSNSALDRRLVAATTTLTNLNTPSTDADLAEAHMLLYRGLVTGIVGGSEEETGAFLNNVTAFISNNSGFFNNPRQTHRGFLGFNVVSKAVRGVGKPKTVTISEGQLGEYTLVLNTLIQLTEPSTRKAKVESINWDLALNQCVNPKKGEMLERIRTYFGG